MPTAYIKKRFSHCFLGILAFSVTAEELLRFFTESALSVFLWFRVFESDLERTSLRDYFNQVSHIFYYHLFHALHLHCIYWSGLGIVSKPTYFPQVCDCPNTKFTTFFLLILIAILIVFHSLIYVCFQALLRTILCLFILLYSFMMCISV